ncbi:MAG: SRPBCC domain-containing protein [Ferruginibacter sp.]
MQTLRLSILIDAGKQDTWDVLLQDKTYRIWTSVFHPGSYAETDWREGSSVLFKTPEGDGLISTIIRHQPCKVISMQHLGVLKNGVEDNTGVDAKNWQGLYEIYRVDEENSKTRLTVELDIADKYAEWFNKTWLKALEEVKLLCEKRPAAVMENNLK